ncbi:MAG: electron transfer flavoprotein subunit alpha/FixB family protein, partial [Kiritimatiellae bacterium]|nr:electron transfer flavoprotein subunit alpha/FixB family protein [Kiritimatiellia bacterium]
LHSAGDAAADHQRRAHRHARLADLPLVLAVAEVNRRARAADRAAKGRRQLVQKREVLLRPHARAAADDDARALQVDARDLANDLYDLGRNLHAGKPRVVAHDLAGVLGGAVGGSRAAVDLGYCEHERQIGQTGVTVRPALMISCGVSGAVQHLAGMQDSAKIIAINTDKDAPIFKVAHYGIVGDLNVVIPKLIKAIRAKGE